LNLKRRLLAGVSSVGLIAGALFAATSPTAHAAANAWPRVAVGGLSSSDGGGYWLTFADGSVKAFGDAGLHGDASRLRLDGPMVGGTDVPNGTGYWLVGSDGGVSSYGAAHFYGSMGATPLFQPIFSMASTADGRGYWLVARDGGIFTFGNGHFYGSMCGHRLDQPIVGIQRSPSGHGYRMVARDGGIFDFGDAPYLGSLPGLGMHVTDVVAAAPTPTNRGYWILRRSGRVYPFGDAQGFGSYTNPCGDPAVAIFSNPKAQGYRIVTASGATLAYGAAPGGSRGTGTPAGCPVLPPLPTSSTTTSSTSSSTSSTTSTSTSSTTSTTASTTTTTVGTPAPITFGDGTYHVGTDIPAGTYRTRVNSPGCVWTRLSGWSGQPSDIIKRGTTDVTVVVTILSTDAGFTTQQCGTFTSDLSAITSSQTADFGGGTYIVGTDIAPGTWRTSTLAGPCFWERLNAFGSPTDVITTDLSNGPAVVTISPTDKGFYTENCTWTTNLAAITASPTAPFGAGTYIVGTDIAAGTWTDTGGTGCVWARLSGFGGSGDEVIPPGP